VEADQSGIPRGTAKVSAEIRDLARNHGAQAIERLVALMHSKNESVAVRATEALLNRGYGRPMQGMEVIEKEKPQIAKQISIVFVKPGERNSPGQDERYLPNEQQVQTQTGLLPAPLTHQVCSKKSRPLIGALP